ncbi:MAG: hypothetical protein ACI4SS_05980, partial [Clostridia bacterium]
MSRNKKFIINIIIVVLVIAVLGGGVYLLTRPEEEQGLGEIATDDDKIKIFSYKAEELIFAGVSNQYGEYALERNGGSWSIEGFDGVELNSTMLDTLVYT